MSTRTKRAWAAALALTLLAGTAGAADFLVGSGQTYSTIQAAVEAARAAGGGTHTVRIMDSADYAESVVLDHANFTNINLTIEAASGQTPRLHSFRTTPTTIITAMPGLTLRRLRFAESLLGTKPAGLLGAVEIGNGGKFTGNVTVESCTFTAAATTSWGVGVYCRMDNASFKVTVTNCNFYLSGSTALNGIDTYTGVNKMGLEVVDCVFIGSSSLVHYGIRDRNTATSGTAAMNIRNNFFYYLRGGYHNTAPATAPVGHITIENNTFVKCDGTASTYGSILITLRTAPAVVIKDNLVVSSGVNAYDGLEAGATVVTDWDADYNAFVNMVNSNVGFWASAQKSLANLAALPSASNNQLNDSKTPSELFANYGGTDYRNDYRLKSGVWALTAASDSSYVGAFGLERPTVTVTANDADAAEAGPDNGQFTISRGTRTDGALVVNYTLPDAVGRATPGSGAGGDYTTTPAATYASRMGSVTIADTATNATVTVMPVDDGDTELSETVVLLLSASADYSIGSPSSNTVTITDNDAGGNIPPVVSAGANKTVVSNSLPASTGLEGSATDSDNGPTSPMTYQWAKVSGPGAVTFGDSTVTNTTASFDTAGAYVLRLSAYDGAVTSSNTVTITVYDNEGPTVDAGSAQNATLAALVSLDGTVTVDDGLPASPGLTYLWTQDSGSGTATFGNSTNIDTTATFNQVGEYVLKLTATDGLGLSGSDTATINVRATTAFTAITNGRFNAASTWDAPGGVSGPPLAGDTAGITNWTVETLSANEVPAAAIVNLSGTGMLRCKDSGPLIAPVSATATINVSTGGTLRVDSDNNLFGTVNLNGGRLMQQSSGEIAAGATVNVNADSEIAVSIAGERCRILAPVHGSGKLTVTGNPGSVQGDGFAFAAGSTWSGAWDLQNGVSRINTAQALPGNLRIAGAVSHSGTGMTIKGVRSGGGSNLVYQAGILTVGNGTLDTPGRGWWSPGDVGVNDDVGLATFGNDANSAGYSPTLRFASNSTFVVDIRGLTLDRYDRTVAFGMGAGTGKVDIAAGAILTVSLWSPSDPAPLNAKIIDTATGMGGDGVLTGSFSQTNWVNAGGWQNLSVTVVNNDLYVTGERKSNGTVIYIR